MMAGRTLVAGIYLQPCSVEADFGKREGGGRKAAVSSLSEVITHRLEWTARSSVEPCMENGEILGRWAKQSVYGYDVDWW